MAPVPKRGNPSAIPRPGPATPGGLAAPQTGEFSIGTFGYFSLGSDTSHIYNLRRSRTYTSKHTTPDRTRPVANQIGERRAPDPNGEPGYLRVDTVHQGDPDKVKGGT